MSQKRPFWDIESAKADEDFETNRLILRRVLPEDLDSRFALYSHQKTRQYFPEGTLTNEETKEELEWFLNGQPEHPELGLWATIHKETISSLVAVGCCHGRLMSAQKWKWPICWTKPIGGRAGNRGRTSDRSVCLQRVG
jgi:RimJ/RimL family protein N-acetyltransferase